MVSGGVFDHGTHERGRSRNLGGPRLSSTNPGFAESRLPVSDARHVAGARVVGLLAQNKRLHLGRPQRGEPEWWPKEAGSRRAA